MTVFLLDGLHASKLHRSRMFHISHLLFPMSHVRVDMTRDSQQVPSRLVIDEKFFSNLTPGPRLCSPPYTFDVVSW
jgi:hypothetical protein